MQVRAFEIYIPLIVQLNQHIYPSLVLVQPRKTRPSLIERLLMGRKESNQTKTNKQTTNPGDSLLRIYLGHWKI